MDSLLLDDIIINKLNPANFKGADSEETFVEFANTILESIDQNRAVLLRDSFEISSVQPLHLVISKYVLRFTILSDRLFGFAQNSKIKSHKLNDVLNSIDAFLDDLHELYPRNFFQNELLTKKKTIQLKKDTKLFVEFCMGSQYNTLALINILCEPFLALQNNDDDKVTYFHEYYLRKLMGEIKREMKRIQPLVEFEALLIDILHVYNFNSWKFAGFMIEKIRGIAFTQPTYPLQLCKLHWYKRGYLQSFYYEEYALVPEIENINNLLIKYLDSEIDYIEKESNLLLMNGSEQLHEKIALNLSVQGIALLFMLLWKSGMAQCQNLKELTRIISKNTKTTAIEQLSMDSLYNNCYKITSETKDEIKRWLFKTLKELDKH